MPELLTAVADADALWLLPRTYDPALRDAIAAHAARLRWIQLFSMGYDPIGLDAIIARTGIPAPKLQAQLLELELAGRVARLPGGLYQRLGKA